MIILEGIRRSGKSYTIEVLKRHFLNLIYYKDLGMRLISGVVDPDSYAIGRDLAYAQFLPNLQWNEDFIKRLLFDRSYWSTYVYGLSWRDNFSRTFFKEHIKRVEKIYGDFLKDIKILFITLTEDDMKKIELMDRKKDRWENTHSDYRIQYKLYNKLFDISNAKIFTLDAFKNEDYIVKTFNNVLND